MVKKVHQRIYGPFSPGTIITIEADPDIAEINYRGNISSYPGSGQANWGDGELEAGVSHNLSNAEPYFVNINAIFLKQEDASISFSFNDSGNTSSEIIELSPDSDDETHLVAVDIRVR